MRTLFTGSRVYGNPRPESDVDFIVLIEDPIELVLLEMVGEETDDYAYKPERSSLADVPNGVTSPAPIGGITKSIRIGRMNILVCTKLEQFDAWKTGTELLTRIKPVDREYAVNTFKRLFRANGLIPNGGEN